MKKAFFNGKYITINISSNPGLANRASNNWTQMNTFILSYDTPLTCKEAQCLCPCLCLCLLVSLKCYSVDTVIFSRISYIEFDEKRGNTKIAAGRVWRLFEVVWSNLSKYADLTREREPHLTTGCAVEIPKYVRLQ